MPCLLKSKDLIYFGKRCAIRPAMNVRAARHTLISWRIDLNYSCWHLFAVRQ